MRYFSGKTDVEFFDPNSIEDIKRLNNLITDHIDKCRSYFKLLASKNISLPHWALIEDPELIKLRPRFSHFIFDEIPSYLRIRSRKVTISKDGSDLERRAFELQEEQAKLALQLDEMMNTLRPTGTTIFLSSQKGTTDILIDFVNLKNNFMISKSTPQLFQTWGLPPNWATNRNLRKGLFCYSNGIGQGFIKTPMIDEKLDLGES